MGDQRAAWGAGGTGGIENGGDPAIEPPRLPAPGRRQLALDLAESVEQEHAPDGRQARQQTCQEIQEREAEVRGHREHDGGFGILQDRPDLVLAQPGVQRNGHRAEPPGDEERHHQGRVVRSNDRNARATKVGAGRTRSRMLEDPAGQSFRRLFEAPIGERLSVGDDGRPIGMAPGCAREERVDPVLPEGVVVLPLGAVPVLGDAPVLGDVPVEPLLAPASVLVLGAAAFGVPAPAFGAAVPLSVGLVVVLGVVVVPCD